MPAEVIGQREFEEAVAWGDFLVVLRAKDFALPASMTQPAWSRLFAGIKPVVDEKRLPLGEEF